jgi:PAS domain S-box-containing protein
MRDVDAGERELTGETQALHSHITKLEQVSQNLPGHKNVDEELDRAWREWKSTFDAIKDSVILTDGEFKIIQANLASSQFFGRPLDQVIGKTCWQLVHGANEAPEGCPLKRAKDTKKHEEMEFYLPQKGIWAADSVDPVLDEQGRLTGVVHIIRDITDRKKAEEALREEKNKTHQYLDIAGTMLLAIDANGKVSLANKKGCETLEYDEKDIIGKDWFDNFIPKRMREDVRAVFKRIMNGEIKPLEYVEGYAVISKSGKEKFISWHNSLIRDEHGKIIGTLSSGEDITERKQAEEKLRVSEERYRKQFEKATDAIVLADPKTGMIVDCNIAATKLVEREKSEIIGKHQSFLHPAGDIIDGVSKTFKSHVTGEASELLEDRVITKSGQIKDVAIRTSKITIEGKEVMQGIFRDITERKKAEEEIAKLAKFPSENPYPVLRIHKNGTVLYANKASEPLLKARSSGMGQPAPAEWHRLIKKALSSGQVIREETKHEGRVFAFRAVPITESNYVNFYGVDITEHKLTDETLRELKHRYQTLFESVPVGIGLATREGRVLECNVAMLQMTGYSLAEFKQINLKDTYQEPQSREVLLRRLQEDGFVRDLETQMKRKDGTAYWASLTVTPFTLGGHEVLLTVQKDMTEHKRAEEALRETSQYLENLFNYANAPIIVWDPQFKITRFNHAFEALTGRSAHDVIGKSIKILFPTDKVESSMEFIRETLEGKRWETIEINILHLDGAVRTVLWNSATLFDLDEKTPVATIAQGQDITERKQAEQKLLEDRAQLKSLASQLTLAEERERHRLATKLHDRISQSLVISKIKLDVLRKSGRSRKLDKALEDICNSIGQTIQDTRTLTFDLSSPVLYELGFETAVSEWLTSQIQGKHGITVEFEDNGEPKPLDDDVRILLFRDVRELLTNVVKHAQTKKVKVSIRKVGSEIHISVEDDGWGFDTKKVAATAVRKGGFGLFSIRERLGQLGGHLEIESEPGCGCKVTMMAPLKKENIESEGKNEH